MSSKTRIIVLHMKEIIYTAVFLALAVVLAVVLAAVLAASFPRSGYFPWMCRTLSFFVLAPAFCLLSGFCAVPVAARS